MFDTQIMETPFTAISGPFADISYADGETREIIPDHSLLSTLRATVKPRLSENEELFIRYKHYYATNIEYVPEVRTFTNILSAPDAAVNTLWLINVTGGCDGSFHELEDKFTVAYNGYTQKKMVTEFFRKEFQCLCFTNEERRSAIVFVGNLSFKHFHYLQAAIPAILPWYFPPDEGLSDVENRLFHSLCEPSPMQYGQCLEEIAEAYDIRTIMIRDRLDGFEAAYEREALDAIDAQIKSQNAEIAKLNDMIGDRLRSIYQLQLEALAHQLKVDSTEESALMEYFLSNPNLYLYDTPNSEKITFVCRGPATYWNEDEAETTIGNTNSTLYAHCNQVITRARFQKLLRAIFLDGELKLNLCAAFSFNLRGNVKGLSGFDYGYQQTNYMPNPHINHYSCMGGYVRIINEMLSKNRNYILAIEQCMASALTLNFVDYTVMGKLGNYLCRNDNGINRNCIVMPDGSVVLPEVAIKWLEDRESKEGTTNE